MKRFGILLILPFFSACLQPGANHEELETPPVETKTNGTCPELSRVVRLQPKIAQIFAGLLARLDYLDSMAELSRLKTYGAEKQFQYVVASLAETNANGDLEMSPQKVAAFKSFVTYALPQYLALAEERKKIEYQCSNGPIDTVDGQGGYGTVPGSLVVKILISILASATWDDLTVGLVHEYTHQISLVSNDHEFVTDHLQIGPLTGYRVGETLGNYIALLMKFDGAYNEFPPQEVGSSAGGNAEPFVDKELVTLDHKVLQPMRQGQSVEFAVAVRNVAPYTIRKMGGATLPSGWSYRNGQYPGANLESANWCGNELPSGGQCAIGLRFTSNYTTYFNIAFPIVSYPSVKSLNVIISGASLNVAGDTVIPLYVHNRLGTPGIDFTFSPVAYNDFEASPNNAPLMHLFTDSFGNHTKPVYRCPFGGSTFLALEPLCEGHGAGSLLGFFANAPVAGANYILFNRYRKGTTEIVAAYPSTFQVVPPWTYTCALGYVPF